MSHLEKQADADGDGCDDQVDQGVSAVDVVVAGADQGDSADADEKGGAGLAPKACEE